MERKSLARIDVCDGYAHGYAEKLTLTPHWAISTANRPMRIVSTILTLLFLFVGTGTAGYLHEAEHARPAHQEASGASSTIESATIGDHDPEHCATCAAIAAAHSALPTSAHVDGTAHRLIARRLAIDGERPGRFVPARRSCRDPPVL